MRYKFFGLFLVVLSISAQAVVIPGWERPLKRATLDVAEDVIPRFPVARSLTLHSVDGSKKLVFSLVEDTGLRCVTTPCPSHVTSKFNVTKEERIDAQTIRYTAWQEYKNIPPNVRIAPRKLVVEEFQGFQEQWSVLLTYRLPGRDKSYIGYPQPIFTPQGR